MIFFLWIRGFVAHSVVEKDSLLLEALNCIRKGDFDKACHDVLSERIFHDLLLGENLQKRVVKNGTIGKWNCWGDWTDYRPFQYYLMNMEEGS